MKKSTEQLIAEIFGCTLHEVEELPVRKVTDETIQNEKSKKGSQNIFKNCYESASQEFLFNSSRT